MLFLWSHLFFVVNIMAAKTRLNFMIQVHQSHTYEKYLLVQVNFYTIIIVWPRKKKIGSPFDEKEKRFNRIKVFFFPIQCNFTFALIFVKCVIGIRSVCILSRDCCLEKIPKCIFKVFAHAFLIFFVFFLFVYVIFLFFFCSSFYLIIDMHWFPLLLTYI